MANEESTNETSETTAPEPVTVFAPDRRAAWTKGMDAEGLERARRLHRIDSKMYKNPDVRVNDADQAAYDELLKKDDAARAKEDTAKKAGEESWEEARREDREPGSAAERRPDRSAGDTSREL